MAVSICAATPRILERGNGPEPDSLDPHRAQGLSAHQIIRDLFEGLVRDDANGNLVPAVAERYEISADRLSYSFHLRADARFSDGSALDARDFVYSFARALDPLTTAPYAAVLAPIAGAEARMRGDSDAPLGVRAVSPQLLEIRLSTPRSDFLRRLALPIAMPVQRSGIAAHGTGFTRAGRLHGNGAYRLIEWTPQSTLLIERNPHYRNASAVAIERVRFHVTEDAAHELKRYAAGELHLTESLPPGQATRLSAQYPGEIVITPAFASFFFGFNLRHPALRDSAQLRQALSLSIDRDILVRYITGNGESAAFEIVPKLAGESGARLRSADWSADARHRQAQKLYAEAGYGPSKPLQIELRYNTSLVNRRLALAIASMWEQVLGVDTRLRNEEWKVFVQNRRAGVVTQVFRAGWFADYADPLNFLEPFTSGNALNASGFASEAFDAELALAARTDGVARTRALESAEQILLDSYVVIPLFHYTAKHLVKPTVCGFRAHPLDHHPSEFMRFCEASAQ